MAHEFHISTWEADLCEFQASQDYVVNLCLKQKIKSYLKKWAQDITGYNKLRKICILYTYSL